MRSATSSEGSPVHPKARSAPLWPLFLVALSLTCHAQADPPALPETAEATGGERPVVLDPLHVDGARPSTAVLEIRSLLDAGHADRALELCGTGSGEEYAWLEARALEALARPAERDAALERVIALDGALSPWARLELALAHPERGAELLAPIASLAWPGAAEAELVVALAAAEAGELDALTRHVELRSGTGPTHARAMRALADRLAESDEPAAREAALFHYRTLDARSPSRELEERVRDVLASLPEERREALAEEPLATALARAEALASMHRHETSEAAFAIVLRRARRAEDDDPTAHVVACQAELGVGRARYRRRARREAIESLEGMRERCRDVPDAGAWALYFTAKSFANLDERADAVRRWDALSADHPDHRLADDAAVEAARLLVRMGDLDGARERLSRVTGSALPTDMRGEARFVRMWLERSDGHLETALAELEASVAEGAQEENEDERGRADYWRGSLLSELGRGGEALDVWVALTARDPLSYYGLQARARIAEHDASRLVALVREDGDGGFQTELSESPGLSRAMALLRVGDHTRAVRELEALGALSTEASDETLWWTAALLDRGGAHHRAVELTRRRLAHTLIGLPPGPVLTARIDVCYPRAYGELIDGAAIGEGIPPSLVFAIAREESSFEPHAVSGAHAYGMLQILRPTASSIAERLGLPSDVRALARPDVSVRIGARYLRDLSRRYEPNPGVVPAAYNAGQGAVDRWLRLRSTMPLDAWIEEIPYGETRRYTRRVLMTQGVYEWLTSGTLPTWPSRLPTRG